jgi:hypothetical protein
MSHQMLDVIYNGARLLLIGLRVKERDAHPPGLQFKKADQRMAPFSVGIGQYVINKMI